MLVPETVNVLVDVPPNCLHKVTPVNVASDEALLS